MTLIGMNSSTLNNLQSFLEPLENHPESIWAAIFVYYACYSNSTNFLLR